jgi:transcriptional regulator with XRE-family HTH domain
MSPERERAYAAERLKIARAFGKHLRSLRINDDHSQDSLARATRLHRTQISLMERGERVPGLLTILILTDALRVSPNNLLKGLPTPKERRSLGAKQGSPHVMSSEKQQLRLLGQTIRSIREKQYFTLPALAAAVSIPMIQLQAVEDGELDPDYELLIRLAECLGTRPSTFITRAEALGKQQNL